MFVFSIVSQYQCVILHIPIVELRSGQLEGVPLRAGDWARYTKAWLPGDPLAWIPLEPTTTVPASTATP